MKKENGISEPCKASEDTKNKARTFDDVPRDSALQQKCMQISRAEFDSHTENYCLHLLRGFDKETFAELDYKIIIRGATPQQSEKIREAEEQGFKLWKGILTNLAKRIPQQLPDGRLIDPRNCNSKLIMFLLRNKYRDVYE